MKPWREYSRAGEARKRASEQTEFWEEQAALQGWYNCSYGACHDPAGTAAQYGPQYPTMGGPMPDTHLVDEYSVAMAKQVTVVLTFATKRFAAANGVGTMSVLKGLAGRVVTPYYDLFFGPFGVIKP